MQNKEMVIGLKVRIIGNSNQSANKVGDIGVITSVGRTSSQVDTGDGRNLRKCNTRVRDMEIYAEASFLDLKEGIRYRALLGGSKDHGYDYELRKGRLYNLSKGKYSTLTFNLATKFQEVIAPFEEESFDLDTLDQTIKLSRTSVEVGCQTISIDDIKILCKKMEEKYGLEA